MLSYIHIDGDFNPRRVTVARVHGGLHPRRVMVARVHGGLHPRRVHEVATTHKGSMKKQPPTKGPRSSNLVYPTMAIAHEGLASLAVDLHEVGDLLALTNSLVQLHNLVGGSQVTPS